MNLSTFIRVLHPTSRVCHLSSGRVSHLSFSRVLHPTFLACHLSFGHVSHLSSGRVLNPTFGVYHRVISELQIMVFLWIMALVIVVFL